MQSRRERIINWLADLGTKYWILRLPILFFVGCDYCLRKIIKEIKKVEIGEFSVRVSAGIIAACMIFTLMPMKLYANQSVAELISRIEALPAADTICENNYTEGDLNGLLEEVSSIQVSIGNLPDLDKQQIQESYINKLNSLTSISIDHCRQILSI